MSNEKLNIAMFSGDKMPTSSSTQRIVSSTQSREVVTRRQIISRTSTSNSSTVDLMNKKPALDIVSVMEDNGVHKTIQTTSKTFTRKYVKKTDSEGQVSEELTEEGEPMTKELLSLPQQKFQPENNLLPVKSGSYGDVNKMLYPGNFQASASFNCILDTGEEQTANFSTGPINFGFNNMNRQMVTDDDDIERSQSLRLMSPNSFQNSSLHNLPLGPSVTTKFTASKIATVTHSSTINGETKTTSKSASMCFSGESLVQASNTMNDMEALFREMTAQLQIEGFNVLKQFMVSSSVNLMDHLALAGGDSGSSILAIESPPENDAEFSSTSPKNTAVPKSPKVETTQYIIKEGPAPAIKLPGFDDTVEEQEQEEVRQKIIRIKEQKSSKGLLWSTMDEVRRSGILEKMQKEEIHLQESIFEIISSEASYNISLDIVIELFYKNELLDPHREDAIIDAIQKHHLFSNILLIKGVSLQLLKDLETRWSQKKPKILDLADIILRHAHDAEFEQQYVNYLANQSYQIESLRSLKKKDAFNAALERIQNDPKCCKLSLDSFLALPMQRLTRLNLLLEVVVKLMKQTKELFNSIPENVVKNHENAIKRVKELLRKSESKKFEIDQKQRLLYLSKILEFRPGCTTISIGSKSLIKEGLIKAHSSQINKNVLRKLSKKSQPSFYLIVFSDSVLIAKKKSDSKLVVLDYCDRKLVIATKDSLENSFWLKFNESETGSLLEAGQFVVLSAFDRDQWMQAITSDIVC